MSASNIILQRHAGYLFSDAAAFNPDGTIGRIESKLHLVPDAKTAVVVRGMQPSFGIVEMMIGDHADIGSLLKHLPKVAERIERWSRNPSFSDEVNRVELAVVAWLDEGRPGAWRLGEEGATNHDPVLAAVFDLKPDCAFPPNAPPLKTADDVFALDAESVGLSFMEMQRLNRIDALGDGRPIHTVGGYCEVAVCGPAGVERKLLREWPDRVGEKISPSPR